MLPDDESSLGTDAHIGSAGQRPRKSLYALRTLLMSFAARAGTRFSSYVARTAPSDSTRLALLLTICGYSARLNGDTVELLDRGWVPALLPRQQLLTTYLEKQCALMPPRELMDPNDERLDVVFGDD